MSAHRPIHRADTPSGRWMRGFVAWVPLRSVSVTAVLCLLFAPLLALGTAGTAQAAGTPFVRKFSANVHGDIVIRGNTLMTCSSTSGNNAGSCANAQLAQGPGSLDNNDYTSQWVDVDNDPATANSSSVTLDLPARAQVLYAALVWGARSSSAAKNQARFDTPDAAPSTVVTAASADLSTGDSASYQSFVDVSDLVRTGGSGVYTLAGVQGTIDADQYAGWALVVAVADSSRPARNLTVFQGFTTISQGNPAQDIQLEGFVTPKSGDRRTTLGYVVYEGDRGKTGDSLKLNGTAVGDSQNPTTNIFNSTLTDRAATTTGRTPAYVNQLGFDADLVAADNILGQNATAATISLTTGGETYYPGVVTFATDLYEPLLDGTKSVTRSTTGSTTTLTYTVPVANTGLDAAVGSRVADAIPVGTTYVPGSLTIGTTTMTDAAGDDAGYFETGPDGPRIVANVGTGATATSGGKVVPGNGTAQYTVSFAVTIDATTPPGADIENVAAYDYRGDTTGEAAASPTNVVAVQQTGTPSGGSNPVTRPDRVTIRPTTAHPSVAVPVLANDSSGLTLAAITDPTGGTVSVDRSTGTITYTPRNDFAGQDAFTYSVRNSAGAQAVEVVYVLVLDDPPHAGDDTAAGSKNSAFLIPVLDNDTDPNDDPLTIRSVTGPGPAHGTVTVVGNRFRYTPAANWTGPDTFTYEMTDSRGARDSATVTVTVTNHGPVGQPDSVLTQVGTATSFSSVLGNDSDPDGDTGFTAVVDTAPGHGTLVLNPDGTGTYTPTTGFSGSDGFTYRPVDSAGAQGAPVAVTVSVNAAPVTTDDSASTPTNTAVTIPVTANDSDADSDALSVSTVTQGAHGAVIRGTPGNVRYTPDAGFAGTDSFSVTVTDGRGGSTTSLVTVTVTNAAPVANPDTGSGPAGTTVDLDVLANDTDPNIPATAQVLTLTAASVATPGATVTVVANKLRVSTPATYAGPVTGSATISDGAGGTATATFTVTISGATPIAADDAGATTPTNTALLIDVLLNDTDADGDPLTIVPGSLGEPRSGGVDVGSLSIENGQVRFVPVAGFSGPVTFTYTATDGTHSDTGVVTLTVLNAVPDAVDDTARTTADRAVDVVVLANDTDPNTRGAGTQRLQVSSAAANNDAQVSVNANGSLHVIPARGFLGVVTVVYTVSDGAGGTDTATLLLSVVDPAPTAVDDSARTATNTAVVLDPTANDQDPNGDRLTLVAVTDPRDSGGVVRGTATIVDGHVRFVPQPGFAGTVAFTYTVDNGRGTASATVDVVVRNADPVATANRVQVPPSTAVAIDVLADDTDPNITAPPVTLQRLRLAGVPRVVSGRATVSVDANGRVVVTPAANQLGDVVVAYSVVDGAGGRADSTLTVSVVAAAPVAQPDQVTASPGAPQTLPVLDNDSDPEGGALSIVAVSPSRAGARLSVKDGRVLYDAPAGFSGTDTFTYTVRNAQGLESTETVTVRVAGAVAAPTGPTSTGSTGSRSTTVAHRAAGVLGDGAHAVTALAMTGADSARLVAGGLALVLLGGGFVLVGSRREPVLRHVPRHRTGPTPV